MKSIIFFARSKAPEVAEAGYYQMVMPRPWQPQIPVWVRVEIAEADYESALVQAVPRAGETVLNAMPLDETNQRAAHPKS